NVLFASVGHIVNLAQETIGSSGSHYIVAVKPRRHDNIISAFFVVDVALTRWASPGGAVLFFPMQTLRRNRIVPVVRGCGGSRPLFNSHEEQVSTLLFDVANTLARQRNHVLQRLIF